MAGVTQISTEVVGSIPNLQNILYTVLSDFRTYYIQTPETRFPQELSRMRSEEGSLTSDFRGLKSKKIALLEPALSDIATLLEPLSQTTTLAELGGILGRLNCTLHKLVEGNKAIVKEYNDSQYAYSLVTAAKPGTFHTLMIEALMSLGKTLQAKLGPNDFSTLKEEISALEYPSISPISVAQPSQQKKPVSAEVNTSPSTAAASQENGVTLAAEPFELVKKQATTTPPQALELPTRKASEIVSALGIEAKKNPQTVIVVEPSGESTPLSPQIGAEANSEKDDEIIQISAMLSALAYYAIQLTSRVVAATVPTRQEQHPPSEKGASPLRTERPQTHAGNSYSAATPARATLETSNGQQRGRPSTRRGSRRYVPLTDMETPAP